jgi:hypothetical protein
MLSTKRNYLICSSFLFSFFLSVSLWLPIFSNPCLESISNYPATILNTLLTFMFDITQSSTKYSLCTDESILMHSLYAFYVKNIH